MDWFKNLFKKKRIYLDYAAATPVLPAVKKEMDKYWSKKFYNPNAIYQEGVLVKKEVEKYRTKIARLLGVSKDSVIFTSGGTEANTWAVRGVVPGKIIIEPECHPSVFEAAKGINGPKVTLVSSITTDNKLGRKIREEKKKNNSAYPLLHIDASQSANYFNVSPEALACDLLTLDAAKLYGPKGIGVLIVRKGITLNLPPLGTPPVPLIAGMACALELAIRDRETEAKRLHSLGAHFIKSISRLVPSAQVEQVLPNVVNVSVPGILPEYLVLALDRKGILVSAGPACESNKPETPDTPIRFSFGRFTTESEVKKTSEIFCLTIKNMIKSRHAAI